MPVLALAACVPMSTLSEYPEISYEGVSFYPTPKYSSVSKP